MMERDKILKEFTDACDKLAEAVNEQLFDSCREWYWIGGIAGGLCDFDSCDVLSTDTMQIVISLNVSYEQYSGWRDAGLDYNAGKESTEQRWINLEHWLMGARYDIFEQSKV